MKTVFKKWILIVVLLAAGCAPNPEPALENSGEVEILPAMAEPNLTSTAGSWVVEPEGKEEPQMSLQITSPAFENMAGIPEKYTCKGEDISPPLIWDGLPEGTASLVLIMDDPDAPVGTWNHWIVFNLPPETSGLEEDIQVLPDGSLVGENSWRRNDYGGPCPPGGARHRYFFKLYALDTLLDLREGVKKAQLEAAMQSHILDQAELIGIYKP